MQKKKKKKEKKKEKKMNSFIYSGNKTLSE